MSIERFHCMVKYSSLEKKEIRVEKLFQILLKVEQAEIVRRTSFTLHPKNDNMPYRILLNSNEYKEFNSRQGDFSLMEKKIIELGITMNIIVVLA